MYFITSNMNIRRGKQSDQFIQHITYETKRFFFARVKSKIFPSSFTPTRQFRISTASSSGMSGHIKFRHNHYVSCSCISNNIFNILLRIESSRCRRIMIIPFGSNLCQQRILLYFNTPSRFIRQMPMKNIQAKRSHYIKQLLDFLLAKEMTALVEHKTPPRITGSIIDYTSARSAFPGTQKLLQSFFSPECAGYSSRLNKNRIGSYLQTISLISPRSTIRYNTLYHS